jgi:NAD(P)-dependent dehydrogenase (short-subunit alcohol dehydrogenase family)
MDTASEFAGKIALITAAAGMGVGQAVAQRLAAGGAHVVVTDIHATRTWEVANRLASEFPASGATGLVLDTGDPAQIDAVLEETRRSVGTVSILVNNAAINWAGPVWDYPLDKWRRTLDVNLTGPWYLARQVMADMRRAGTGGAIINITSGAAEEGGRFGGEPVYAITKGAMQTMTRALAVDGGPYRIRVNSVSVGVVADSKFIRDHPDQNERWLPHVVLGRHVLANDVAEAVAFLASGERAGMITGDTLSVNGGSMMRGA